MDFSIQSQYNPSFRSKEIVKRSKGLGHTAKRIAKEIGNKVPSSKEKLTQTPVNSKNISNNNRVTNHQTLFNNITNFGKALLISGLVILAEVAFFKTVEPITVKRKIEISESTKQIEKEICDDRLRPLNNEELIEINKTYPDKKGKTIITKDQLMIKYDANGRIEKIAKNKDIYSPGDILYARWDVGHRDEIFIIDYDKKNNILLETVYDAKTGRIEGAFRHYYDGKDGKNHWFINYIFDEDGNRVEHPDFSRRFPELDVDDKYRSGCCEDWTDFPFRRFNRSNSILEVISYDPDAEVFHAIGRHP